MALQESNIRCCGRYALEWVSFIEKNPGKRFVRCADRVGGYRFWEWIDDLVPPLARSVMDDKLKRAERKVKILGLFLLLCLSVVNLLLYGVGSSEDCISNCSCGRNELPSALE
ncbi:hypothetical protein LIER_35164 [Lithospermum erythrorhizon]|uniref:Zinc finger GRF-type domain-containing protein n=1 Tax=Lithospermum erythrorhizon TaxID=34254 RepID=A0AAV3NQJ1_LITER